jgi:hypothetical protein
MPASERALRSLAGMQGDLEGLAGKVLPGLDALALPGSATDAKPAT